MQLVINVEKEQDLQLLVSLLLTSKYRPIFDAIKSGAFTLLISNEILTEYEEKTYF